MNEMLHPITAHLQVIHTQTQRVPIWCILKNYVYTVYICEFIVFTTHYFNFLPRNIHPTAVMVGEEAHWENEGGVQRENSCVIGKIGPSACLCVCECVCTYGFPCELSEQDKASFPCL